MLRLVGLCTVLMAAVACAESQSPKTTRTVDGQATVALSVVPNDVRCLRITASGSRSAIELFEVTAGQDGIFLLRDLPLGPIAVTGEAFAQPCVDVTSAGIPNWLSAVALAEIKPDVIAALDLVLRRNDRSNGSLSFDGDAPVPQGADLSSSVHLQLGLPLDGDLSDDYLIDRVYWVASYNNSRRVPNWVAWRIVAADFGATPRQDTFRLDALLPSDFYKVTATDYRNSGYDRGHLCPSADRTASVQANSATFLMSNMNPQTASLNQGVWANFEDFTRSLVKQGKDVQVIAGGIFSDGPSVIGPSIAVAAASFKVVVVLNPGEGLGNMATSTLIYAIVIPNANNLPRPWGQYLVSVDDVEAQTGYDLLRAVPDEIENIVETHIASAP